MNNPQPAIRDPQSHSAFTLIEVVLVSVILGVLLAAAVPRFQRTAQRLRVEQTAFELAQLLRVAHEQAVSESHETVWVWDDRALRVRVEPAIRGEPHEPQDSGERLPTHGVIESSRLPEGISVSLTREDGPVDCHCVHFFPEGTAESTTLTVSFREHVYTVTVDETTGQALLIAGVLAR